MVKDSILLLLFTSHFQKKVKSGHWDNTIGKGVSANKQEKKNPAVMTHLNRREVVMSNRTQARRQLMSILYIFKYGNHQSKKDRRPNFQL